MSVSCFFNASPGQSHITYLGPAPHNSSTVGVSFICPRTHACRSRHVAHQLSQLRGDMTSEHVIVRACRQRLAVSDSSMAMGFQIVQNCSHDKPHTASGGYDKSRKGQAALAYENSAPCYGVAIRELIALPACAALCLASCRDSLEQQIPAVNGCNAGLK